MAWIAGLVIAFAIGLPPQEPRAQSRAGATPGLLVARTAEQEVTLTRRFAAPRADVFAALTTPPLLRRWLRVPGRELVACEVDLRPGGAYRYLFRAPDGSEFGMHGTFSEVVPAERTVHLESYVGSPWPPLRVTTELSDESGGTLVVTRIRYPSKEICDMDFQNLERGAAAIYEGLAALLAQK
jgi:uncharacterized protein YndB with AHSA1/START domain